MKVEEAVSLKHYSTFKIGGPARYFVTVTSTIEMQQALQWAREKGVGFHILGKGSNSLFSDQGFDGLVIYNKIDHCIFEGSRVNVGAGFSFSLLGIKTAKANLGGLEFASGIPGSVGGAIYMNAGANGQETATYLEKVTFIDTYGVIKTFKKEELEFKYRYSSFHKMEGAILDATFVLPFDDLSLKKQRDLIDKRIKTQPYNQPSCGCIFRNPVEGAAGKLIEECGLKGISVGEAIVSTLHANFIVNGENATAKDVMQLIETVRKEVKTQKGIDLHPEILVIPYRK